MKTWTDSHFALTATDTPLVTAHDDRVALHLPGYEHNSDGHGFTLTFFPAHLPQLRRLIKELEQIEADGDAACLDLDLDPDEDACLGPGNPEEYGDR